MSIARLMVVDDDTEMREMLTTFLRRSGFYVASAATRSEILTHLDAGRIDLILLDVMLGDESGVAICTELREAHEMPIILVSALSADHNRMAGYASGADDYIAKPFNPDLLLARVRAVLRRNRRAASLAYRRSTASYRFEGWHYDGRSGEVHSPQGVMVPLSRREAALLKVLLANPRIPLTRDEITDALDVTGEGGSDAASPASGRALDVLVGRLRSKIETNPKDPQLLRTERGVGYVFAVDVHEAG
ncbi:Transcriptional regulatory protein OmpR [Aquimixticola soesokkakensis]|uniref:Transcriptional regulatory protein OmpR n=1 Tax=Aquimixticola soesokkakensis TaxID=1519096 RepID=A0A1Y5RV65_9RHOB|nr:response regulator transcription factor [Aquimixticola soesokkakensis]SLN25822.1 Transcriptional regulatory protein OmpR [Aquimixticola soesokkakensis]